MPEVRSAPDTVLTVSRTTTILSSLGETRPHVTIGVLDKLAVLLLLRKTFNDHYIRSIQRAEQKIIP